MSDDWKIVYSCKDQFMAEMLKSVLKDNDIEAVIINKKDSFYHFGELEVYVKADKVIPAKRIMERGEFE